MTPDFDAQILSGNSSVVNVGIQYPMSFSGVILTLFFAEIANSSLEQSTGEASVKFPVAKQEQNPVSI